MSQIPACFERKFDFMFPVEQFPHLVVRLQRTPARLEEEMLRAASREVLLAKPEDNHLLDRVENLPPALLSRSIARPRLQQPMRLVDHLYFVAEYDDHRLARIRKITRVLGSKNARG